MNKLELLLGTIDESRAVNNDFYRIWVENRLELNKLAIFVRNYWEWTFRFPEALASLVSCAYDLATKVEYTKILYSEMGNGNLKKSHSVLFEQFSIELSKKLGDPDGLKIEILQKTIPLLPTTIELNNWQKEVYSCKQAHAIGAQLALEWQAYTMIRKLYEGARNYITLWQNQDEFHEACEFFYIHIGEAEKEHKKEAISATEKAINNGLRFDDVKDGFNKILELIANFWDGISHSLSR